jgi:hypothetical protein
MFTIRVPVNGSTLSFMRIDPEYWPIGILKMPFLNNTVVSANGEFHSILRIPFDVANAITLAIEPMSGTKYSNIRFGFS